MDSSLEEWIALSFVVGVGSRTAAVLIDRFGTPAGCFAAPARALELAGLQRESIEAMKQPDLRKRAKAQLSQLRRLGAAVLTLSSESYPALLRETYDPPIVLYTLGDLDRALSQPAIAMVGSRRCSTYGRNVAERLA